MYVVLYEDKYESMFGDGKFHYFGGAFLDQDEFWAQQRDLEARNDQWKAYHYRSFTLEWDEVFCYSNDLKVQSFNHFSFKDTLEYLDRKLQES